MQRRHKVGKKGKERLDKYYHLAKEQGYRARSAFKLIQLTKKFDFLSRARAVVDLCAAPGGWLQVATKCMPVSSVIVGVDLVPIRPIPNVITITDDITKPSCRTALRRALSNWKADVVLHDGSPNVGSNWDKDAFAQNELVLSALRLATEFLRPGGTFVSKVFRSRDYNALLVTFRRLFKKVTASKPSASRSTSAELFVVCEGFLAPKPLDPALLDPERVFANPEGDQPQGVKDKEAAAMVLRGSEKRRRHREGYADDVGGLVERKVSVSEFVKAKDAVGVLANATELQFVEGSEEDDLVRKHPATTEDMVGLIKDLKVLGKAEFRVILKWRLQMRKSLLKAKDEEEEEEEGELDEVEQQKRLVESLEAQEKKANREEHNKEKKKQKKLARKTARMEEISADNAKDLAVDLAVDEQLFTMPEEGSSERLVEENDEEQAARDKIAAHEEEMAGRKKKKARLTVDGDDIEEQLDAMYEVYKAKKRGKQVSVKMGGKDKRFTVPALAPENADDVMPTDDVDEPEPLMDDEAEEEEEEEAKVNADHKGAGRAVRRSAEDEYDDDDEMIEASEGEDESEGEDIAAPEETMSKRAAQWFGNDLFQGIDVTAPESDEEEEEEEEEDNDQEDEEQEEEEEPINKINKKVEVREAKSQQDNKKRSRAEIGGPSQEYEGPTRKKRAETILGSAGERKRPPKKGDFEVVPAVDPAEYIARGGDEEEEVEETRDEEGEVQDDGEDVPTIGPHMGKEKLVTALALGKTIAGSRVARERMIDDSYNRYAFDDPEGSLPDWFVEEEKVHMRAIPTLSKEAIVEAKKRVMSVDARPIKKIAEAKARKRQKGEKRKEMLRSKAIQISSTEGISEADKAQQINRMVRSASKTSSRQRKTVLVSGKSGSRIGGAKRGRTKLVDSRMKKDMRGTKRAEGRKVHGKKTRRASMQGRGKGKGKGHHGGGGHGGGGGGKKKR